MPQWYRDPQQPEQEFGWVNESSEVYVRAVKRIAVRCRQANGSFAYEVLISALSSQQVLAVTKQSLSLLSDEAAVLLAYVRFYDQRGGGVETSFKGDKQGLGIGKRRSGEAELLYRKCIFYACKFCEREAQEGILSKETVHNSPFSALIEELIPYIKTSVD